MIFNLKEQRMLEKTMQTLDLEQHYSMKLIGLGNRQVKIGHTRLKSKVISCPLFIILYLWHIYIINTETNIALD